MLIYETIDNGVTIQNRFYKIFLSKEHGGTIRKLEYNGEDVHLTREGCEYWEPDSSNHYEQEYSRTADFEIVDKGEADEFLLLKVKAKLVSPQLETEGGDCVVHWLFRKNSPMIYSDYQVFPTQPYLKSDRYLCFDPALYNDYSVGKRDGTILNNKIARENNETWIRDFADVKWSAMHDGENGVAMIATGKLSNLKIYKSFSMGEIKMRESKAECEDEALYTVYLPYSASGVDLEDFREMRLKTALVQTCREMEKRQLGVNWFKTTLKEYNRGIWFLKNMREYVKDGMKVIDIGGGIGAWGAYLNYVNEMNLDYINADVDAVKTEMSEKMFAELGIRARFITRDWKKIYVEKQDAVFCFGAIHHFDKHIFKVANSVLKENGLFIFEMVEKSRTTPEDYRFTLTYPEIGYELRDAGFEILRIEYCGEYAEFNDIAVVCRKKWDSFYIRDTEERHALIELAQEITDEGDSDLIKAYKFSAYCKKTIDFPNKMPEEREWYYASGYESLTKWRIGNCKNYATSLIALSNSVGIDARLIWLEGKVATREAVQGHVLSELKIDGKWILFDAMYGVPFHVLGETWSAYECWNNPDRYIESITPERRKEYTRSFWHGLWTDFRFHPAESIKTVGETSFVKQWYGE